MNHDHEAHLVRMANEIAANIAPSETEDNVAEITAGHISKFWALSMKKKIIDYVAQGDGDLSPIALQAVKLVGQQYSNT